MSTQTPDLQFVQHTHEYWLGDRRLPSVTQVLKDAGLVDARWYTDEARLRGEYVHLACHMVDEDDLALESLDRTLQPYVEAYQRFLVVTKPRWDYIEHRVCDEGCGYAGTLDRAGVLPDGRKVLVDIKTGMPAPWAALQLAAYRRCLPEPHTWKRIALQLKGDGSFTVHDCTDRSDEAVFQAALTVTQFRRAHGMAS